MIKILAFDERMKLLTSTVIFTNNNWLPLFMQIKYYSLTDD